MKKIIDKYVPALIEQFGIKMNPILLNLKDEHNQVLVFYFHGLYESSAQKELGHVDPQNNLTLDQFSAFIDYFLEHQYCFIRAADLLKELPQDQPYAMITFDDGYFNNRLALDILEQYEIPATFFITTRNILENRSYWWDIIYKYRNKEGRSLEKIREEQEALKAFKYQKIDAYINQHFGSDATIPWSDIDRPFSPDELKCFARNPWVEIGNHTANHSILTNCSEPEIMQEFKSSNQILLELLGEAPESIAFPNGSFNDGVVASAQAAGFQLAFTTEARSNSLPRQSDDLICLDRYMAKPQNVNQYGSFSRLGYTPDGWYSNVKDRIKSLIKL